MSKTKYKGKTKYMGKTRNYKKPKYKRKNKKTKKRRRGGDKRTTAQCEIFMIDHNNYNEYQEMLSNLMLCDTDYISPDLESMTYDVLEYEELMDLSLTLIKIKKQSFFILNIVIIQ